MKHVLLTLMLLWLAALVLPASAADTVYYYYTNTLHSAAAITDAHGNVVERTYYAPYGRVLNRPMRDGPGYTGHDEDPATGLVYMQQRYYDALSGRFLSTDPVLPKDDGANFNRYWYADDNPYRYTDPDGRETGIAFHSEFVMMGAQAQTYQAPGDWLGPALQTAFASLPVFGPAFGILNAATSPTRGNVALAVAGVLPLGRLAEKGVAASKDVSRLAAPLMHDHHLLPREFKVFFSARGIDIDEHTISLGEKSHLLGVHGKGLGNMPGGWNKEWGAWIKENPNATQKDVFQRLGSMMDRYYMNGVPIHPYRQ